MNQTHDQPDEVQPEDGPPTDPADISASLIWNENFSRLVEFARTRMQGVRRGSFDEEDIALSAINSLYQGMRSGKLAPNSEGDEIWKLLVTIAMRKITAQRRRLMAAKRLNERTESALGPLHSEGDEPLGIEQVLDHRTWPESSEALAAVCSELFELLGDDLLRQTALCKLEGYSLKQIAERMGSSLAITKQRIQRIRRIWSRLHET